MDSKKIRIFVASSDELKAEREALASLANSLNTALESNGIQIIMVEWENLDASMGAKHKQEEYNEKLRECDMCIVMYWTKFGMYTETEFDIAVKEMNEGRNPHKIYVYFKKSDNISPELKKFGDSFPTRYGHFFTVFENSDTLKAHFLLQFIAYQTNRLQNQKIIEVKNGSVTIDGKKYVELKNVPFACNNEDYNQLLRNINFTQKILSRMSEDDDDYIECAGELKDLNERLAKMESNLWDTALMITRLSTDRCSKRLELAMTLFNQGDNKGARAILDEESIEKDANHNLNLIELGEEGRKGLLANIQEYRLAIKTYENELSDDWQNNVERLYQKCIDYGKKVMEDADYAELMIEYGDFLIQQKMYDNAEAVLLESQEMYKRLYAADPRQYCRYLIHVNHALAEYYEKLDPLKAKSILEETLEVAIGIKDSDVLLYAELMYMLSNVDRRNCRTIIGEAINLLEANDGMDSPRQQIARLHLLGKLYIRSYIEDKTYDFDAEIYLNQALDIQNSICEETGEDPDFSIYKDLGECYLNTRDFESADCFYQEYYQKLRDSKIRKANFYLYLEYMENLNTNWAEAKYNLNKDSSHERQEAYQCLKQLFLISPARYALRYVNALESDSLFKNSHDGMKLLWLGFTLANLEEKESDAQNSESYWKAKKRICEDLYHIYYRVGDYEDAISHCEELLKIEEREETVNSCPRTEEKARIHVNMSKCYQAISDNEHAVRHFREAVSLIKNDKIGWQKYELLDSEYVWSMCLADFNQDKWEAVRDLCLDVLAILEDIENSLSLEVDEKIDSIQLREKIHILLSIACKKSGDNDSALSNQKKAEGLNTEAAVLLHDWSCELDEEYGTPLADWEDLSQEEFESLKNQGYDMSDYHHYQDALSNWANQEDSIFKFAQENGLNLFSEEED